MVGSNKVTVVMYHYVRELANSDFPDIKGLELAKFRGQLDYLIKTYHPITMEQLIEAVHYGADLPPKAVLLTFDDGYADHFRFVLPVLIDKKLQGSFYPPAQAILEHKVLDVNKIHFILASAPGLDPLLSEITCQLAKFRTQFDLPSDEYLFKKLAIASNLDSKEIIFIKRLLQVELPRAARTIITDNLFRKFVSDSESGFSKELYMSLDQIRQLKNEGMHIGSHGYAHEWLGTLSENEQRNDIEKSLEFLSRTGSGIDNWTMAFPFGSYNPDLLTILNGLNCKLAFRSIPAAVADISTHPKLELPRIDTVDLPFGI